MSYKNLFCYIIVDRGPIAVFSLAFFSVVGRHAVNLGHYTVLKAATLSFEQGGG